MTSADSSRTTRRLATVGGVLGIGAGIAELIAGSRDWTGNKDQPTLLGWVTVGLGVAVIAIARRYRTRSAPGALLAGLALLAIAVVGTTTAGWAWTPAAVLAAAAIWSLVTAARTESIGTAWRTARPIALLAVLGAVYLAFAVVHLDGVGWTGVAGAVAVAASVMLRERARPGFAALAFVGVVPFALLAYSTVVIPLTGLLILAIGLPHARAHAEDPALDHLLTASR